MKQRVISAFIGLCVLAVVVVFLDTILLNICVSLISVLAVYEVLAAAKYIHHKELRFACFALAVYIPFLATPFMAKVPQLIFYMFAIVLFAVLLIKHNKIRIEEIGFAFLISVGIPLSFANVVFIRDNHTIPLALLYILVGLGSAWWSDTSAFFAGRAFGKHKLAPNISPKKTVEGAIGGVCGAVVGNLLVAFLLVYLTRVPALSSYFGGTLNVFYWRIALLSPILSVASIFGDLSASMIKRQFGVKDYGSIMPGHGGIMDRFDSVLFVLPLVALLAKIFPFGV